MWRFHGERLRIPYFMAPDGASTAGASDGTQNTDTADPSSADGATPASVDPGAATSGGSATSRSYTQAEVDALLSTNQQESFDKGRNLGFAKGAEKAEKDAKRQLEDKGWTDEAWTEYQDSQRKKEDAENKRLADQGQYQELIQRERTTHEAEKQQLKEENERPAPNARHIAAPTQLCGAAPVLKARRIRPEAVPFGPHAHTKTHNCTTLAHAILAQTQFRPRPSRPPGPASAPRCAARE